MPSPEPWYLDDLEQEAVLARLEAEAGGFDPDTAEQECRREYVASEARRTSRERTASNAFRGTAGRPDLGSLDWVSESQKVVGIGLAKETTPGQKQRFLRNQMILVASIAGMSQRQIAKVFNLPPSRVFAIVREMRDKTGLA
jgi:hypothetical protein